MKKIVFTCLVMLLTVSAFAQRVIDNPDYGMSTIPGSLSKIEILEYATVLHFHLKGLVGTSIFIPEKSYIQDLNEDDKFFIAKVTGAKMGKNVFPDSGELIYELHFPKLGVHVKSIDFGEDNDGGNWFVYDIIINESNDLFVLPKELRGNWMLADGSNQFHYGFNSKNAIVNRAVWNYKSVDSKGKKHTIVLEKNGELKTVYAKLNKNGRIDFGETPKTLLTYSLEKINNPKCKLANDTEFTGAMFNMDYAKYSGIIKGFTKRAKQKTGTAYVNNIFTGNQETCLIKIADDGSFSIKLQIGYPQSIFVRLLGSNVSVFVEPGKETFQYMDGEKSFFMGDCAQVNTDLQVMTFIRYFDYPKTMNKIGVTSPEDYKKVCFHARDKEFKALEEFKNTNSLSAKAFQIKKLEINYSAFERILGYEMYRGSIERRNKAAKSDDKKKPFKVFNVDKGYYDFISKDMINNKMAVLTSGYNHFINRLMYANIFKSERTGRTTLVDMADWLLKSNKELTLEELDMVEMSKEIEAPEIFAKESKFREVHGKVEQAFYKKYMKDYNSYLKEYKVKPTLNHFLLNMADFVKGKGDTLSSEEIKMLGAVKVMKTPEELEKEKAFNKAYGKIRGEFYKKHKNSMSEISMSKHYSNIDDNMYAFFGGSDAFMFDIIRFQRANKKLEDFKVYSDEDLNTVKKQFKHPFLASYFDVENKNTKIKIEANKTKGGYTINTLKKSEGDELFDSMLKKFKGKVVYVDFWATWCGPCKSGISRIASLKEEMKDEDMVFLYITNQTSPEGTWKNSIPNIKGEHYRVSADEWNYLSDKFKITGIPHYTLVNKEGEVVKSKMGHLSNERLMAVLKSEMEK